MPEQKVITSDNAPKHTPWVLEIIDDGIRHANVYQQGREQEILSHIEPSVGKTIVDCVNAHAALIEELRKLAIVERVTSISSNDDNSWMHCKICGSQWGKFYGNTKEKHKADCVIYDALSPQPTKE